MKELTLRQTQSVVWRSGSWLASQPNALTSSRPSGRRMRPGRRIFSIFSKTLFSALLSVSFDAIERSFDNSILLYKSRFLGHTVLTLCRLYTFGNFTLALFMDNFYLYPHKYIVKIYFFVGSLHSEKTLLQKFLTLLAIQTFLNVNYSYIR